MSFLSSGVAAVTGAGSGIGRALAQQLAAAGSALALADIDEAGLQQTAQSLGKTNALVTTHGVDVANLPIYEQPRLDREQHPEMVGLQQRGLPLPVDYIVAATGG